MKLTYAITACNELDELKILIPFLKKHKRPQDEIVILFDQKNGKEEVINYLITFNKYPNIQSWRGYFNNDFSDWKNQLKNAAEELNTKISEIVERQNELRKSIDKIVVEIEETK